MAIMAKWGGKTWEVSSRKIAALNGISAGVELDTENSDDKAGSPATKTNVEGSDGAIVRFNEWQTTALGRDINPDKLRSLILSPRWAEGLEGAIRVDVVKPEHTAVADTEVAAFSGRLTVSHKSVTGVV